MDPIRLEFAWDGTKLTARAWVAPEGSDAPWPPPVGTEPTAEGSVLLTQAMVEEIEGLLEQYSVGASPTALSQVTEELSELLPEAVARAVSAGVQAGVGDQAQVDILVPSDTNARHAHRAVRVAALPWELVAHGPQIVFGEATLVRRVVRGVLPPIGEDLGPEDPLRVVVGAGPAVPGMSSDERLHEWMVDPGRTRRRRTKIAKAPVPASLSGLRSKVGQSGADVLVLVAHGENGRIELAPEDEGGDSLVSGAALAQALVNSPTKLVLLESCFSSAGGNSLPVAFELARNGIACVGMQWEVHARTVHSAGRRFLRSVQAGESVSRAMRAFQDGAAARLGEPDRPWAMAALWVPEHVRPLRVAPDRKPANLDVDDLRPTLSQLDDVVGRALADRIIVLVDPDGRLGDRELPQRLQNSTSETLRSRGPFVDQVVDAQRSPQLFAQQLAMGLAETEDDEDAWERMKDFVNGAVAHENKRVMWRQVSSRLTRYEGTVVVQASNAVSGDPDTMGLLADLPYFLNAVVVCRERGAVQELLDRVKCPVIELQRRGVALPAAPDPTCEAETGDAPAVVLDADRGPRVVIGKGTDLVSWPLLRGPVEVRVRSIDGPIADLLVGPAGRAMVAILDGRYVPMRMGTDGKLGLRPAVALPSGERVLAVDQSDQRVRVILTDGDGLRAEERLSDGAIAVTESLGRRTLTEPFGTVDGGLVGVRADGTLGTEQGALHDDGLEGHWRAVDAARSGPRTIVAALREGGHGWELHLYVRPTPSEPWDHVAWSVPGEPDRVVVSRPTAGTNAPRVLVRDGGRMIGWLLSELGVDG